MTDIITGYYGNVASYNPRTRISISRKTPGWAKVYQHIEYLAPSEDLLYKWKIGAITWEQYEEEFKAYLNDSLDRDKVLNYIESFDFGDGVVLLCWEKDEAYCHRRLVLDWLMKDV